MKVQKQKPRKATIYDIAKDTGTSPTTVSFVLNGFAKQHRIKDETAELVVEAAERLGYAVNLKARGLRLSRSGLAGMIVPHYRNRFFAGLAEAFEAEARARGLCPVVVSTQRDAGIEASVIETLLAQQTEFLFVTGVHDPDPLNEMCRRAGVASINIDLPGSGAPSVVSDNYGGARALTEEVLKKLMSQDDPLDDIFFFGGLAADDATMNRVRGFTDSLAAHGLSIGAEMIDCCGYPPDTAAQSLARRYEKLGRMPRGLFVNGVTALEGALQFASSLPRRELDDVAVGSFDWDPFAAHLSFEVTMVRQNVEAMIVEAFALLDSYTPTENPLVVVPTSFGRAGRGDGAGEDWRLNPVITDLSPP
jgi:LacI family transcriptional regulator, fructose operon transcriptional repressor